MIKNWKLFLESNSDISYETLSEVITFLNNSNMQENKDIHKKIEHFVNIDLDEDSNDLIPFLPEEHKQFRIKIKELVGRIKSDSKLSNDLLSLYSEVEDKMRGLPKFYELEDLFLDFIDGGWIVSFDLEVGIKSMIIEVTNEMTNLDITYSEYVNLQEELSSILSRLITHFNLDCDIIENEYIEAGTGLRQGNKNVVLVKFELSTK